MCEANRQALAQRSVHRARDVESPGEAGGAIQEIERRRCNAEARTSLPVLVISDGPFHDLIVSGPRPFLALLSLPERLVSVRSEEHPGGTQHQNENHHEGKRCYLQARGRAPWR